MNNETATGRFIDVQAVYNKLNEIADIAQTIEQKLTYIFGKFFLPVITVWGQYVYGRRYIAEPPDVLWKRYEDARKNGAPVMTLNYLLEQFYIAEFVSNQAMADYYIKLIYVEPDPHDTALCRRKCLTQNNTILIGCHYFDPIKAQKMSIEQLRKDF